jgi:hypothetical protein
MISVSVSIDVPSLADGIRFYSEAFGFAKVSEPIPGIVVLRNGDAELLLLEKEAGSKPALNTQDTRRYERHWTPVHLDIHVDDFKAALAQAIKAARRASSCSRTRSTAPSPSAAILSVTASA